jgi:hypothetical protein
MRVILFVIVHSGQSMGIPCSNLGPRPCVFYNPLYITPWVSKGSPLIMILLNVERFLQIVRFENVYPA